ncbi:MAG: T9SS type A sorting domain-containing protein [Saprospiraceae bacterium]|nr:MAG: hypothetical protein UZ09_BCD002000364 [Bacteroidetes bacterium OLB9]MCO6464177.1 T9SS type A sorting domain-containing protein [Saprospiraceae bacterium]MCZ2338503.1 T9SS type A sorting domain-containing protein [Chitinophagales bacterium]
MKHIFTLVFLYFSIAVFGQFNHSPNPVVINAPVDSVITKYKINIEVERDTNYVVYWELKKDSTTWNENWATQVCDLNLCYLPNVDRNPKSFPNYMGQGNYDFYVYFIPNGVAGQTHMELVLYGDDEYSQELYTIEIDVNASTTSTKEISKNLISVYPNPASDYFSIANGNNVSKIKIYNMFGAEVKSFYHYNNAQHLVGDLKPGMYILRMLDNKNNTIKTVKFNKIHSGA